MFRSTLKDVALSPLPNGKVDFTLDATGNPVHTSDETPAVRYRLAEHLGRYWADAKQGSTLYLARNITRTSSATLQASTFAALQPLVDAGRIIGPTVAVQIQRPVSRAWIDVKWQLPGGGTGQLRYGLRI